MTIWGHELYRASHTVVSLYKDKLPKILCPTKLPILFFKSNCPKKCHNYYGFLNYMSCTSSGKKPPRVFSYHFLSSRSVFKIVAKCDCLLNIQIIQRQTKKDKSDYYSWSYITVRKFRHPCLPSLQMLKICFC